MHTGGLLRQSVIGLALVFFLGCQSQERENAATPRLLVYGEVTNELSLTVTQLKAMPPMMLKDVALISERMSATEPDFMISRLSYRGVLLRDILLKAGMKHRRKWEPGVFFRVRNAEGKEAVFSFGEIFYSSTGHGIVLAYQGGNAPITPRDGVGQLIVANDIRCGRCLQAVTEIVVERVNMRLEAYVDRRKKIVRPPTIRFDLVEHRSANEIQVESNDLEALPSLFIPAALMVGDCEGFHGVFSFEGPTLKSVLTNLGGITPIPSQYNRYVLVSSDDGFCATFSWGEIFNSRLDNNIIIALKKDGKRLDDHYGFAASVVGEDSTGGRSIKRISRIEVF